MAEKDQDTEVRSVIDVDILGHIFDQSITDLEHLPLSLEAGIGARTFLSAERGSVQPEVDKNVRAPQAKEVPTTRPAAAARSSSRPSTSSTPSLKLPTPAGGTARPATLFDLDRQILKHHATCCSVGSLTHPPWWPTAKNRANPRH